ncbi:hypothetical protein F4810DRAFT_132905 [Camillea tinctor]|nr:hypothetical protein F4810DRAFT_132905 [Camillea tinctor]
MEEELSFHSPGSSSPAAAVREALCLRRILHDLKDFAENPYPKIELHPRDNDITVLCLVLHTGNYGSIHLTVRLADWYPLTAPAIEMNSAVKHPNVYGSWICATILSADKEYTPAYTLKGIAIQMLSFFDSERVEQEHARQAVRLDGYSSMTRHIIDEFSCAECGFGPSTRNPVGGKGKRRQKSSQTEKKPNLYDALVDHKPEEWPSLGESSTSSTKRSQRTTSNTNNPILTPTPAAQSTPDNASPPRGPFTARKLPTEVILRILDYIPDFRDLTSFARAWPRVSSIVRDFDVVRQRELQCFWLKTGYREADLGVGVALVANGRQLASEFDLLSREAFVGADVRASVHNVPFQHWLPLPIARGHWGRVRRRGYVGEAMRGLREGMRWPAAVKPSDAHVLFTFMNDIVVRLNLVSEENSGRPQRSALLHASEKAIESYFHLFHLLVCLATEDPSIAADANRLLERFAAGHRTKVDCPNLGHLLVALLISDVPVTEPLIKAIITEAITRNVVWLLDKRGSGKAELSFMEGSAVSAYRLDQTFIGSRTSYRLLMFSELFRRTARPSSSAVKPLAQVRDELFERHGGPPRGAAERLAAEVRRLHKVGDFPAFMREMGLSTVPTPAAFTAVLRETVQESMRRGYSKWALSRDRAMALRARKDPQVQLTYKEREWLRAHRHTRLDLSGVSFFPNDDRQRRPAPTRNPQN